MRSTQETEARPKVSAGSRPRRTHAGVVLSPLLCCWQPWCHSSGSCKRPTLGGREVVCETGGLFGRLLGRLLGDILSEG